MPFIINLQDAQTAFPEYGFVAALTPSEQKAAFHVRDADGQDLCLKIIAPNYNIDRLQREILAMQSINHPNVASLKEYTFSTKPGHQRHYLVEEFVTGSDLSDRLRLGQPWSRSEAAAFFIGVCDGLSALMDKRIVHRDLKPSNIRVRLDGSPVIIDFGLARLLDQPDLTRTADGAAIGTPLYFAPEQITGTKRDIDHRTDLFALGILLYQAVVGYHPFRRTGLHIPLYEAVCTSHDHLATPEFITLPREWQMIISRLLEKERGNRPHNAAQVAKILSRIGAI